MATKKLIAASAVVALSLLACTGDDDGATPSSSIAESSSTTAGDTTTTEAASPATSVPARVANVSAAPDGTPNNSDVRDGYTEVEYFVDGTAFAYEPVGELGPDGEWELTQGDEADYRTRILVRTPSDPEAYSGFTLVEWNNVTVGADGTPDWMFTAPEIMRRGHAYVSVSAQKVGVEGAAPGAGGLTLVTDGGLTQTNPERYGSLTHPGDDYSYDIFGQVLEAIRAGDVLGDLEPEFVIAMGESQSAFRLTAYVNGVHEFHPFDGYLVHARGGGAAGFVEAADLAEAIEGEVRLRDIGAPVFVFSSETDVKQLGYGNARQPDSESFRSWEVAGTAHADAYLIGGQLGEQLGCEGDINEGPQYLVLRAALAALVDWVGVGIAPPEFAPLELSSAENGIEIARDEFGVASGGVRTPAVDTPKSVLSGDPRPGGVLCFLSGSTDPIDLVARYGDAATYRDEFDDALTAAIEAGAILPADADEARADGEIDDF